MPATKQLRCAIYTRKSTEHNLDLEFNSLDAQREACEAYIKSQAHEGWRLIPQHYDDGGLSGASLERPALQALLQDIEAGKIDVVVVYKVDRLTRSLTDFAKLVELFDAHEVSFVSVTQSFNTTSSMGRLTLNVLLSFAQFEREVIGERVRDKIAASKRKGLWVGGPVPLGYQSINKKLHVVPDEAEAVRTIYRLYLEAKSVRDLAGRLDKLGIHTKKRRLSTGRTVGGGPFGVGALAHLLQNRFYIGEVVYRGEIFPGDHEPIVDREMFDAVQKKLADHAVERQHRLRASPALLTGRIFDADGNRMTPSHTSKKGVRYRYYVSHASLQRSAGAQCPPLRVPAPEAEALVVAAIRERLSDEWAAGEDLDDREVVRRHLRRVAVGDAEVVIAFVSEPGPDTVREHERDSSNEDGSGEAVEEIVVPWVRPAFRSEKGISRAPSGHEPMTPASRDALLTAIAKARAWVDDLANGRVGSFAEIAEREGKVERHIRLLVPLAFVSPGHLDGIIAGDRNHEISIIKMAKIVPDSWPATY
ncbi:recombinase family protein [Pyruvatibacter sp.]|uniref:recombinase family protein n=1 Tax=Pyruvatibacter sp. TaxID=1981328 RepID=UPI0032EB35DC